MDFLDGERGVLVKDKENFGIVRKVYSHINMFEVFAFKKDSRTITVATKGIVEDKILFSETDWGKVFDYLLK